MDSSTDPRISSLATSANYVYWQQNGQEWADEYRHRRTTTARYGIQELVLASIVDANVPARVLEFGCGVGRHLSYLAKIPGADVHGVDQSPTMLAGMSRFSPDNPAIARAQLIQPLGRLPFENGTFDIVYSAEVLVHVRPEDLDGRLAEFVRVGRGSIFHLEPPESYQLAADAHDGCWYHDLVAAYARLGLSARRAGQPVEAQELVVVDLDPARPLRVPGTATLRHFLNVEAVLQSGLDRAASAEVRPLRLAPAPHTSRLAVEESTGARGSQGATMTGDHGKKMEPQVGSSDYFPTQSVPTAGFTTISHSDVALGAPLGPLPPAFLQIPAALARSSDLATPDELTAAQIARAPFHITGYSDPFMDDIVRAFRVFRGGSIYIEIGTFDRGNLAYAATLLADDALIIGVDMQDEPDRDARLHATLSPAQKYVPITGNSRDPRVAGAVKEALGGRLADGVFIDGDHTAFGVMCDYVNFSPLVRRGGFVMFHDALWEGNERYKGSSAALEQIDRFDPVYLVTARGPLCRYLPPLFRDTVWGSVAVCPK